MALQLSMKPEPLKRIYGRVKNTGISIEELRQLLDRMIRKGVILTVEEGYDEMHYARIAARHFGTQHSEYYVTPQDVADIIPALARSYDEPFGNSSAVPVYYCAKLAADKGVTRMLAGDGGDELFAGNERYLKQKIFEYYHQLPVPLRKGVVEPILNNLPQTLPLFRKAQDGRSRIISGN